MIALKEWILEGAPDHYQSRKVALFRDKETKRMWVQLQGTAVNPYGRGEAEVIAWPSAHSQSKAKDEQTKAKTEQAPHGSHSGMTGSHSGQ